jgi:hypothetical protein
MNLVVLTLLLEIPAVLALVHALTRSSSAWAAADRNRPFWLFFLTFAALLPGGGLPFDIAYAIGVVPRLTTPHDTGGSERSFMKDQHS